jgi:hypothetical protein
MEKLVLHRQICGYAWWRRDEALENILFTSSVLGLGRNEHEKAWGIRELHLLRAGYRRTDPS